MEWCSVLSKKEESRGCFYYLFFLSACMCVWYNIDVVDNNNNDNDYNGKARIHHRYPWGSFVILSEVSDQKTLRSFSSKYSAALHSTICTTVSPGQFVNTLPVQYIYELYYFLLIAVIVQLYSHVCTVAEPKAVEMLDENWHYGISNRFEPICINKSM